MGPRPHPGRRPPPPPAGPPPDTGAGAADPGPAAPLDVPAVEEDTGPTIDPALAAICAKMGAAYAQACDIHTVSIWIDPATPRPANGQLFPGVKDWNMNGWEWFQKWPTGFKDPDAYDALFDENLASDMGLKCSVASALRFAAVMHNAPADLVPLLNAATWEGRFFNWNDDYSHPTHYLVNTQAGLWAWASHLIKWMSVTFDDGTCHLPTIEMLEAALKDCLATANSSGGNITGCQNP